MEIRGWIYVITNKAMPDLVKIGISSKDLKLLAAELNLADSPHPYIVEFSILVKKPHEIEQKIHSALLEKNEGKKWFRCSLAYAVKTIKTVIGDSSIPENKRLDDSPKFEVKAEGKVQDHPVQEWETVREEILNRWRRKDQIQGEITALLNLYSSGSAKITEAIKKKYGIEISRHRIRFNNLDEVVSLIDEALEDKEREDRKRKIRERIKYDG